MTAADLLKAMAELELNQTELAARLDISDRQMRRYVAEDVAIPRSIEYAIAYIKILERRRRPRRS